MAGTVGPTPTGRINGVIYNGSMSGRAHPAIDRRALTPIGVSIVTIAPATCEELPCLKRLDRHVSADTLRGKIARGEVLVARDGGAVVGWLRFGWFWDAIPFVHLIGVVETRRGRGIGTAMMSHWEQRMRDAGCTTALVSTQADERAQHFYRKLGYRDIGGFVLPGEAMELILHKTL